MNRAISFALLLSLICVALGCVVADEETREQPRSIVRSLSLPMAMNGVTRVGIHPRGRLVRVEADKDEKSLRSSMDSALMERFQSVGYEFVPPNQAEVLFAYAVGVSGKLEDAELARVFGVTAGMQLGDGSRRGAIVLAALDTRTGRSNWRASVSAEAKATMKIAERDRAIRNAIDELLRDLPRPR